MKKRILLFALIVITITCLAAVTVNAATYSGTCGNNLTWTLDTSTGVLEIDGTGEMYNWGSGNYAPWYSYGSNIKSVTIGDSVTSIGDMAFWDCTSLTSVVIPDSITSIGGWAFTFCDNMTSVVIPDSVTSIGDEAFYGCTSLTSITVDKANTKYSSDEYGVLFNKDKTTLIQYPIGNIRTSYTIPDSVTSIGDYAFHFCSSLTSVDIPDSVTSIGDWAFEDCDSLTSVVIPDSVTSIGDYAFAWCTGLTSVVIPDSVTSIGDWAFEDCDNVTIYGYTGGYAEEYANDNGILFTTLGYNITFVDKDGNKIFSQIYEQGEKVELPEAPALPGYIFLGWSTDIDGDELITEDFFVSINLELKAIYQLYDIMVVFNANSGDSERSTQKVFYGYEYGTLPNATRDGYAFLGWFTDLVGGERITAETLVKTSVDHYLYAHWIKLHEISFVSKNGEVVSSVKVKDGETVTLPGAPEIYGFEFLGWSDGINDELITEDFTATADITLTAVYKKTICTITFLNEVAEEYSSLEYKLDSTVTLPDSPNVYGYTFLGWSDGVSDELITEDFTATADITLTAVYKGNEYLVIFEPNGGSISESTKNVTFGSEYGDLPVPVREEYEFTGWYTENGRLVTESTVVNTAEMHILYAKWTRIYTVEFRDINGELISSAEYKTDEKVIFPDVAEITGYTFAGWSYSADGKIITGNVYVDGDLELYARYDANKYMVIFVANGGSVSTTNKTVTYDSPYGDLPAPVREGFVFDGWFTSSTGSEKISEDTIVKITEMQYLYAHWTEKSENPGDVNADGKVDRKDLTRLAQYFARWDVELGK